MDESNTHKPFSKVDNLRQECTKNDLEGVSNLRIALPQILASSAKNLILLDLGMTLAFPTIVIPILLKSTDSLKFTPEQASWYGSIALICQPAGSFVSGLIFEPLGRKRAMVLVNIPHIISWLMLYFATTTTELYIAGFIMGLGIGFMEAPILTYVGEICQPRWRGILTSFAGVFVTFGYIFVYLLGTVTDWHTAAAICSSVPCLAVIVISQVPESPIWLASKGRFDQAEKSLCWLRGWISPDLIQNEFNEIKKPHLSANIIVAQPNPETFRKLPEDIPIETKVCNKVENKTKTGFKKILAVCHLDNLVRRQTLQPLILITLFFIFHHSSGVTSTRPFMVQIFDEMGSPIDGNLTTLISSLIGLAGNIICMLVVHKIGKRALSLYSLTACALINIILSGYILSVGKPESETFVPVILYLCLSFMWNCGMGQLPWMLTGEVFPFKGRGLASGIAAAVSYIIGFLVTKTYNNLHNSITLGGVFGIYGISAIIGSICFYFILPETEGKTLNEIEIILEDKFQTFRKKALKS